MSKNIASGFGELFEAVKRVGEARGVRREGESLIRRIDGEIRKGGQR